MFHPACAYLGVAYEHLVHLVAVLTATGTNVGWIGHNQAGGRALHCSGQYAPWSSPVQVGPVCLLLCLAFLRRRHSSAAFDRGPALWTLI